MQRLITHLLIAGGLVAGTIGVAEAHSDVHIGVTLGAPAYVQPAPVYVQPAPVYAYGASYSNYGYHHDPRWGRPDYGHWNHSNDRGNGWGRHG